MTPTLLRAFGIVAFVMFAASVILRLVITWSGVKQSSAIGLSGTLIGLGGAALLCWAIFALVMAPVGRLLVSVGRSNPDGAAFVVVTDTHLDSALRELGIERARKSRFIALVAEREGIRLLGRRASERVAEFGWAEIHGLSVGTASSKWSTSAWSNIIMSVRFESRVIDVPLSVMPGRSAGNYTPSQMRTVINRIDAQRPRTKS
ncbi:hypothetical protein ACEXQE_13635 [Herbiconiux sp. P17]|uniref:hypothetical protein n=1 Tax=Herbiconiux wuyangfengii TaxID=3342794 RepID=UPI0035B76265